MARLRRSKDAGNEFFPGFTDIAEIGIGSLATVYRAREIGTNRSVALKLLNVRDASPRALESFERESVALGAVSSHPNIVTLYRSFRAADGRPVLVLELCRGSIGDTMVNGRGLPVADVVGMGIKIAGALETAHRAQILHRDVKPQNILITDYGEPALADFGVAMLQSSTQTTAGLFDFTTLHAAPELLEGGETSAATDVYELASSLYQLIAGKSAFRAYDGESPASVILRILRDPVQPLLNAHVPSRLSDLLVEAMSKDKDERPPTAVEFAAQLAEVEATEGWQRTPFLIRDASGGAAGLPGLPRAAAPPPPGTGPSTPPAWTVEPAAPPAGDAAAAWAPAPAAALPEPTVAPVAAPAAGDGWGEPVIVTHRAAPAEPVEPPAPVEPPVPVEPPAPVERAPLRIDGDDWSTPRVVDRTPQPPAADPAPPAPPVPVVPPAEPAPPPVPRPQPPAMPPLSAQPVAHEPAPAPARPYPSAPPPQQFPIPPSAPAFADHTAGAPLDPAGTTAVPTWAFRAPTGATGAAPLPPGGYGPGVAAPAPSGELTLDPTSLRRRVTLRSGMRSLAVDEQRVSLRSWWSRTAIAWEQIHGFEIRAGEDGSGQVVALTGEGPVPLPATKRTMSDLRYVHALLEAYRLRAQMTAHGQR